MHRPLLSICIPTYNRAKYLPECLDSIIPQLNTSALREDVEIVIADNASTDTTTETVHLYQKEHPNVAIVYFRNEKNIGFDRSFTRLIEKCKGEYCLSLGDDDALFERAILTILAKIKENNNTPFFGLNCWGYDALLENQVLPHPNLQITKDEHYATLSEYIHSIQKYTNLVGIFVGLSTQLFKRDPWVNFHHKDKFFDTLAVHMYVNLSIFKDSPFAMIAEPIVKTRSSNIRWDVFAGLETVTGRIHSTLEIATWIRDAFKLPISTIQLSFYFYTREYWFTLKEVIKRLLVRAGLQGTIAYYRKLR